MVIIGDFIKNFIIQNIKCFKEHLFFKMVNKFFNINGKFLFIQFVSVITMLTLSLVNFLFNDLLSFRISKKNYA